MDSLNERLKQILNDPERMKQLMETAAALGLQNPGSEALPPIPELTEQVTSVLHTAQARDEKQQALIRALLPYLQPGKQRRLERAMQIAQLTHLAGYAMQRDGSAAEHEEDSHV